MAQGVDNFLYELTLDGSKATFKFWDPQDVTNTETVSLEPNQFPQGATAADSREVQDYAYAQVAEQMNAKRSDRIKAAELQRVEADQERAKTERQAVANHFGEAEDNVTSPIGTEVREDGIKQNVFSSTVDSSKPSDNSTDTKADKKK